MNDKPSKKCHNITKNVSTVRQKIQVQATPIPNVTNTVSNRGRNIEMKMISKNTASPTQAIEQKAKKTEKEHESTVSLLYRTEKDQQQRPPHTTTVVHDTNSALINSNTDAYISERTHIYNQFVEHNASTSARDNGNIDNYQLSTQQKTHIQDNSMPDTETIKTQPNTMNILNNKNHRNTSIRCVNALKRRLGQLDLNSNTLSPPRAIK